MNFIRFLSYTFVRPFKNVFSPRGLNVLLGILILFVVVYQASATTPNPGHPWTGVGDGIWAATGTTVLHTFTFPNFDANAITSADYLQGSLLYGSGASSTAVLLKDTNATRYLSNTGTSNNPAWSQINLTNGVTGVLPFGSGGTNNAFTAFSGPSNFHTYTLPDATSTILTDFTDVTLAQGGTGATLVASNGGIVYSNSSTFGILAGVAANNRVLMSQNAAAPIWSTATYPATATASGSVMVSDGTNFVSQDQTVTTAAGRSYGATGGMTATAIASPTVFRAGLFYLNQTININVISISNAAAATPAQMKICVYNEAGNLLIDSTSSLPVATTAASTTLASTVQLRPGNYYAAVGCTNVACSVSVNHWTSTTASQFTTFTVGTKKVYEGTATMSSAGKCNPTLPTITAAISSTPALRFDN